MAGGMQGDHPDTLFRPQLLLEVAAQAGAEDRVVLAHQVGVGVRGGEDQLRQAEEEIRPGTEFHPALDEPRPWWQLIGDLAVGLGEQGELWPAGCRQAGERSGDRRFFSRRGGDAGRPFADSAAALQSRLVIATGLAVADRHLVVARVGTAEDFEPHTALAGLAIFFTNVLPEVLTHPAVSRDAPRLVRFGAERGQVFPRPGIELGELLLPKLGSDLPVDHPLRRHEQLGGNQRIQLRQRRLARLATRLTEVQRDRELALVGDTGKVPGQLANMHPVRQIGFLRELQGPAVSAGIRGSHSIWAGGEWWREVRGDASARNADDRGCWRQAKTPD